MNEFIWLNSECCRSVCVCVSKPCESKIASSLPPDKSHDLMRLITGKRREPYNHFFFLRFVDGRFFFVIHFKLIIIHRVRIDMLLCCCFFFVLTKWFGVIARGVRACTRAIWLQLSLKFKYLIKYELKFPRNFNHASLKWFC